MSMVIDIHCHLFNADDIPIKGVIDSRAPKFIAVILDKILQAIAPGDRLASEPDSLDEMNDEEIILLLHHILETDKEARRHFQENFEGETSGDALSGVEKLALVKRYIRWIRLLSRSHGTIARKIRHTYPEVDLFVPLMMDMDYWFDDQAKSNIRQQFKILSKISLRSNGSIHPFVAFDPERERRFPGQPDGSLALVRDAVMKHGFLGVKLYPPLGYTPAGNEAILPPSPHPHDYNEVFDTLFRYCQENEIPITTHCTNGGAEAQDGFGVFADPKFWDPILEKYPKLRVNFAHFGGDRDLVANHENSWAWKIGALMQDYPHVYADTGHHSIPFDKELRHSFFKQLELLFMTFPKAKERLMFGTDWHMIVRTKGYKKFYKRYLKTYSAHFTESETDQFVAGNAIRFLGLQPGEKGRERLYQYYTRNGLEFPAWWNQVG